MLTYFNDETKKENIFTIGFYNLENLYDIYDDPVTLDEDFSPRSDKHWNLRRYNNKIENLSEVIVNIGIEHSTIPPVIRGVAEVENDKVLTDLVQSKLLLPHHYDFVHFDSMDDRGIDVALLYQKKYFELLHAESYALNINSVNGEKDFTRDILCVKGNLNGEFTCFIVNHWPSRRESVEFSAHKRIAAAQKINEIIQEIYKENVNSKIIVMGDFNDEPYDESIKKLMLDNDLFNPMQQLKDKHKGTSYSQNRWYLFDQILFSMNYFNVEKGKHTLKYADTYDSKFIKTWKGKRKNTPFRTYVGSWHQGGFSDHFPVLAYLERF